MKKKTKQEKCSFYACRIQNKLSVVARGQDREKEGWITKDHKENFEDDTNICYFYYAMVSWMDAFVEN